MDLDSPDLGGNCFWHVHAIMLAAWYYFLTSVYKNLAVKQFKCRWILLIRLVLFCCEKEENGKDIYIKRQNKWKGHVYMLPKVLYRIFMKKFFFVFFFVATWGGQGELDADDCCLGLWESQLQLQVGDGVVLDSCCCGEVLCC